MNTELLQDAMEDLLLLNSVFLDNHKFYEIFARDVVISELTNPVRYVFLSLFGGGYMLVLGLFSLVHCCCRQPLP